MGKKKRKKAKEKRYKLLDSVAEIISAIAMLLLQVLSVV